MREIFLILHFIGLAMGVGTSIVMLVLGRASAKMEIEERKKFMMNASVARFVGHTGLALLILTGLYLMTPHWQDLGNMPYMIAKLILVAVLVILVTIIAISTAKAKKGGGAKYMKRAASLGPVALLVALTIIVLAVMTFR